MSAIVELSDLQKMIQVMESDKAKFEPRIVEATRKMLAAQKAVADAKAECVKATQELSSLIDARDNLEFNQTELMQRLYCKNGQLSKLNF